MEQFKMTKESEYRCNVIAYIVMYIKDNTTDAYLTSYDVAYEVACELADQFIGGEYDVPTQGLYDCICDYMEVQKIIGL